MVYVNLSSSIILLVLVLSKDMRVDCRSKYNTAILMQAAKEILYISIYFYTFIPLYFYTFIKETVLEIISFSAQNWRNVRFQGSNSYFYRRLNAIIKHTS